MKRLICLPGTEAKKVRARQVNGTMTELYDDENYLCFDEDEYKNWESRKVGRKPKRRNI